MIEILKNIVLKGKIYIPKKVISAVAYIIVPAVLLVIVLMPAIGKELHEDLGEWAQILLIGILYVKPLSVLLKPIGLLRTIVLYRRQLGVTVFYLSLAHFLTYDGVYLTDPWTALTSALSSVGSLWYGAVALLLMFVLYLTSNNASMKFMKKWWKRLQRISYFALFAVLIHAGLMEGEGYTKAIVVGGTFIVLKALAWLVIQKRIKAKKHAKKNTTPQASE